MKLKGSVYGRKRNVTKGILENLEKVSTPIDARDQVDALFFYEIRDTLIRRFRYKEWFKIFSFCVIMLLTIFVVVGAGFIIWYLAKDANTKAAAMIAPIGGLLSTLIGLPLIITKYLFNEKEDETITAQLSSIRGNDLALKLRRMGQEQAVKEDGEELNRTVEPQ